MQVVIQVGRLRRLQDGGNLSLFVVPGAGERSKPQEREREARLLNKSLGY